jgi:hypothetical protein
LVKILKFFDADADPGILIDPGSGMEKIRHRDKHPGSATLVPVVHIKAKSCLIVAMCGLEAECGQLEDDIALDLEEAAPDEAPRLQVEQLHRLVVRQVRDGLCVSKKTRSYIAETTF